MTRIELLETKDCQKKKAVSFANKCRLTLAAAGAVSAIVVANHAKATTDIWNGNVSGNINTTEANWTVNGTNGTYIVGDDMVFADGFAGSNRTFLVTAGSLNPNSMTFSHTPGNVRGPAE